MKRDEGIFLQHILDAIIKIEKYLMPEKPSEKR